MEKIWVISLGGSRIVPDDVDDKFLLGFKKLLDSHKDKKFVVVCGGGSSARRYISALRRLGKNNKAQSMEGIAITRLHAGFMARFFGKEANEDLPMNMVKVKNLLKGNRVVFTGALRWRAKNTSDGAAAKIAGFLDCSFINLTNVKGLYSSNPKTNKKAKFISKISWKDFLKIAGKIKYEAGQHFVLDLVAAREIERKKIITYIVGSLKSLDSVLLRKKKVVGTVIGNF
jgi:uridylate kinase